MSQNLVLCRECREAYGIYPTVVHTYAKYCDICCDVESEPEVWQNPVVPIGVYDEQMCMADAVYSQR